MTKEDICNCEECLICLRWFPDASDHKCVGGHCSYCKCFFVNVTNHECPFMENMIDSSTLDIVSCAQCARSVDASMIKKWDDIEICELCFHLPEHEFKRERLMRFARSQFSQLTTSCAECKCELTYYWELEHHVKDLIYQGDENGAQQFIKQNAKSALCLSCLTNKHRYMYGDDDPWVCKGKCKRHFEATICLDHDRNRKEFSGKTICIECYSSDHRIFLSKKLIIEAIKTILNVGCGVCKAMLPSQNIEHAYNFKSPFNQSLLQMIELGNFIDIYDEAMNVSLLCNRCWNNIKNVESIGLSHDRQMLNTLRTDRMLHPSFHTNVEMVVSKYSEELLKRRIKSYKIINSYVN